MPPVKIEETDEISLSGEAYLMVRDRILRGEISIGSVVSRRKIAAELGVSLVPVSEAFMRLEFEGLLESRPRAGTRVKVPTEEDVRGIYIIREALETAAARLFTEVATAAERVELQKLAVRVDHLAAQPESRFLYLSLHEKLHRRIAECTKVRALWETMEKHHALTSTWLCANRSETVTAPKTTHQDLMKILVGDDAEASASAMRIHISTARDRSLKRLAAYFQINELSDGKYKRAVKKTDSPKIESRNEVNRTKGN